MRIVDAVTYLSVLSGADPSKLVLVQRYKDNMIAVYHVGCMSQYNTHRKAVAIAGTTDHFAVYLLDDIGPQPYCRACEVEHWSCPLDLNRNNHDTILTRSTAPTTS